MYNETKIDVLVGKTIEKIDSSNENILFVCKDEAFEMYHMQDCCESVRVHNIDGDLQSLIGKEVVKASCEVSDSWPNDVLMPKYTDSFTWTTFTIETVTSKVTVRWLGESNGYYSESVYFGRTHKPL